MFIAVNANKPPSPFGGADAVAIYHSTGFRSSERRRSCWPVTIYKHVAPNGAKTAR